MTPVSLNIISVTALSLVTIYYNSVNSTLTVHEVVYETFSSREILTFVFADETFIWTYRFSIINDSVTVYFLVK